MHFNEIILDVPELDLEFESLSSLLGLESIGFAIISEINSEKLDEYFIITKNTICGRNPIIIAVSVIQNYKKHYKDKKVTFDTIGYAQSNKVKSRKETSVSYAAMANYIS